MTAAPTDIWDEYIAHWEKYIHCTQGLFHPVVAEPRISGPKLTRNYDLTGEMLAMETMLFEKYASQEQKVFSTYLERVDTIKLRQYILVVVNAERIWKDDVKVIETFLRKLTASEALVEEEEQLILHQNIEKLRRLEGLVGGALRQDEITHMIEDFSGFVTRLRTQEQRIEQLIKIVKAHLALIKRNYPFL